MHLPSTNLTSVQKGVLYSGTKIYNHLPSNIKALANDAKLFNLLNIHFIVWMNFISQHPNDLIFLFSSHHYLVIICLIIIVIKLIIYLY